MKTNYLISAVTFIACLQNITAQPSFQWARQIAGPAFNYDHSFSISKSGNVYAAGTFVNTVDFDPGPNVFNLNSTGQGDIFISSFDASGNFIWSKSMGGPGMDLGRSITVDSEENVIAAGCFENVADLDPGNSVNTSGNQGEQSIFITKLNASGNLLWSRVISSLDVISCNTVKTDALKNIYITGSFRNQVDFDPGTGSSTGIANGRMRDLYVVKLDPQGNFIWKAIVAANCNDVGSSFSVDPDGNVFISGSFYGMDPVDFDPSFSSHIETPSCLEDVFILKLNSNGSYAWVKKLAGTFYNGKTSLALDKDINLYVAGNFQGTVDMDPDATSFVFTANGNTPDCFISKFNTDGTFIWSRQLGGVNVDEASSVTVSHNNEIILSGMFTGNLDADPGVGTSDLNASGQYDIFLCKLDVNGNFLCAGSIGGSDNDRPGTLLFDNQDNLFLSGTFPTNADVDPGAGTFNITPGQDPAVYLCKLGECGISTITNFKESDDSKLIGVYPNPSTGKLTVINSSSLGPETSQLVIYNTLGEILYSAPLKVGNNELNISGQPQGIYFACISGHHGQETIVKKIVVQ